MKSIRNIKNIFYNITFLFYILTLKKIFTLNLRKLNFKIFCTSKIIYSLEIVFKYVKYINYIKKYFKFKKTGFLKSFLRI